jgi:hypothetical protein
VGRVFFPLDEQLGLLPSGYSPFLVETMVRLGARLPFGQVADEMRMLFRVSVSADTVRRLTEQAGMLQVAMEERHLEQLEQEAPDEPEGPDVQQLSADGVMVHLVNGKWTEVRTTAIGSVDDHNGGPHVGDLSYFSRRCSADEFIRQATLPTYERGTRRAGTVIAVMDGASWLQELISEQCPEAVRIIDFPHAVGYLTAAAQAALGAESPEAKAWLDEWVPKLKTREPDEVLAALGALPALTEEAVTEKRPALRYLGQRREQIRYAAFQKQGYPIGSGIVESGGKLVVQARLAGSGMRWKDRNISPLVALRGRLCSGQWERIWPRIRQEWLAQTVQQREEGRSRRRLKRVAKQAARSSPPPAPSPTREQVRSVIDGKPTAAHPWKKYRACSAA